MICIAGRDTKLAAWATRKLAQVYVTIRKAGDLQHTVVQGHDASGGIGAGEPLHALRGVAEREGTAVDHKLAVGAEGTGDSGDDEAAFQGKLARKAACAVEHEVARAVLDHIARAGDGAVEGLVAGSCEGECRGVAASAQDDIVIKNIRHSQGLAEVARDVEVLVFQVNISCKSVCGGEIEDYARCRFEIKVSCAGEDTIEEIGETGIACSDTACLRARRASERPVGRVVRAGEIAQLKGAVREGVHAAGNGVPACVALVPEQAPVGYPGAVENNKVALRCDTRASRQAIYEKIVCRDIIFENHVASAQFCKGAGGGEGRVAGRGCADHQRIAGKKPALAVICKDDIAGEDVGRGSVGCSEYNAIGADGDIWGAGECSPCIALEDVIAVKDHLVATAELGEAGMGRRQVTFPVFVGVVVKGSWVNIAVVPDGVVASAIPARPIHLGIGDGRGDHDGEDARGRIGAEGEARQVAVNANWIPVDAQGTEIGSLHPGSGIVGQVAVVNQRVSTGSYGRDVGDDEVGIRPADEGGACVVTACATQRGRTGSNTESELGRGSACLVKLGKLVGVAAKINSISIKHIAAANDELARSTKGKTATEDIYSGRSGF